jgi:hypothetical protein
VRKHIIFIFLFLLSPTLRARLVLDVGIIHRTGLDKGIVLESELHSVKTVDPDVGLVMEMKNKVRAELSAFFVDLPNVYGPTDTIEINGEISRKGKLLATFEKGKFYCELETKCVRSIKFKGQEIELIISPHIR